MKKIIFFLIISCFAYGQEISPYYPAKQGSAERGNEPTQLTYYDSMYVQSAIGNFMANHMMMSPIETALKPNAKSYTNAFQDKFSNGKLYFTFNVDQINTDLNVLNKEIITSIKITGTPSRLIDFYVDYWKSTLHLDFTGKKDAERKQFQDVASFYFNKGKPYILVKNSSYKNTKEFENSFNALVAKNK